MEIYEARQIAREYLFKSSITEDEEFMMIEALEYLIAETKDPDYMADLGGYYYEQKDYDLALKYYEMAYSYGHSWAPEELGYIWYYGRTGQHDYEKAFKYYSKEAKNGYMRSEMKVA